MGITSINLSCLPFQGSCDSTRAQMAAKQISQALTHKNCDIPYVISDEYQNLVNNCPMGMCKAPDSGRIVFKDDDLIVVHYDNLDKLEIMEVPQIKKTSDNYASTLRYSLLQNQTFKKGDIIFEYDCFRSGVPSFGYNVFTGYFSFFGYNHEDSLTISESFADKAKYKSIETICIPIQEYTMMQPIYQNQNRSGIFFPGIGQKVVNNVVGTILQPKTKDETYSSSDLKQKMMVLLKSMSLSDLLNIQSNSISQFTIDPIKTKIEDAIVTGIKIHRVQNNVSLVDSKLQHVLEEMRNTFIDKYVIDAYTSFSKNFGDDNFTRMAAKKYLIYKDKNPITNRNDIKNCVYLIELEVTSEHKTFIGDKVANRYANKGIISLVLPDELRPIALESNQPIDLIFNPFGVFSRMNLSQLTEGVVSKNTMICDRFIRTKPDEENLINTLNWLNNSTIKYLSFEGINSKYYKDVQALTEQMKGNECLQKQFINNVIKNNLFIEAPTFSEIDVNNLIKHSHTINETVLIKRETIKYIKDKIKVDMAFPLQDIKLKNIFCAPIYIMKLCKLVSHIIAARDLGSVKAITKQPLKGRASEGGSHIGQMEIT